MKGKIIILSAPSGTGKSTIINRLLQDADLKLGFSISATSRKPRGQEQHGREYFFLTPDDFRARVANGEFVEWEEVYADNYYGTLESEVKRVTDSGHNLIMDVDVKGALNIKKRYGSDALAIFIMPPSLLVLENRLRSRCTDAEETIKKRLQKAEFEIGYAPQFDCAVVNDDLDKAVNDVEAHVRPFIGLAK